MSADSSVSSNERTYTSLQWRELRNYATGLQTEVERLRAALKDIASYPDLPQIARIAILGDSSAPHAGDQTQKEFFSQHALGPLARPSCLVCGQVPKQWPPAIQHLELPGIIVCFQCRDAARFAPETKTDDTRDAERYRYLRERGPFDRYAVRERLVDGHLPIYQTCHGDTLDRELDECIGLTSAEETTAPLLHADMNREEVDAAMRQVKAAKSIERCATCGMPRDRHGDRHPFQSNGKGDPT